MTTGRDKEINVLKLTLHDQLVGYLAGFHNGRNVLSFTPNFRYDTSRATFSLITHPNFPHADKLMAEPWVRSQRLHPTLSNLLPEGMLRELVAQALKIHVDALLLKGVVGENGKNRTLRIFNDSYWPKLTCTHLFCPPNVITC